MDIASSVGTRQVAGSTVLSPEMDSTITTCSNGDRFPEIGAFDSGPVFSQGHRAYSFEASFQDDFLLPHPEHSMFLCILTEFSKFMGFFNA